MDKWANQDQPLPLEIPARLHNCVCSDPNYYFADMTINIKNGDLICTGCQGKIAHD